MKTKYRIYAAVAASMFAFVLLAPPAHAQQAGCPISGFDDRCESREARVGWGIDSINLSTLSVDQDTVYLFGHDETGEFVAGAFNAETGRRFWLRHPDVSVNGYMSRMELVGDRLVLSGTTRTGYGGGKQNITVFGLDVQDGDLLWETSFNDMGADFSNDLAVSSDGSIGYIVGTTRHPKTDYDLQLLAVDISSGDLVWERSEKAPGRQYGGWAQLSPDSSSLYVTSSSNTGDARVSAFDTRAGKSLWRARFTPHGSYGYASQLAVDPAGRHVFLGGEINTDGEYTATLMALEATTGTVDWVQTYEPTGDFDSIMDMVVDPSGDRVFVTGSMGSTAPGNEDIFASGFSTATGRELWTSTYGAPAGDWEFGVSIATTDKGGRVFVTGYSTLAYTSDIATLAFDGGNGEQIWAARYNGSPVRLTFNSPMLIAVGPTGSRVHVVGLTGEEVAVLSYES